MDKRKMAIGVGVLIVLSIIGYYGYREYQKQQLRREAVHMIKQLTAPASDIDIHTTSAVKSMEAALTAPVSQKPSSQAEDEIRELTKQLSN